MVRNHMDDKLRLWIVTLTRDVNRGKFAILQF